MTLERIEELKKQAQNKYNELTLLQSKSEKDLWKEDLKGFEKIYKKLS